MIHSKSLKKESSLVGIVIVNWNSWEVLSNCLGALKNQRFQDFKVLIVDNASEIDLSKKLLLDNCKFRLIRNESNIGFAAASNQGCKLLEDTKWVACLNPDAVPAPDWLENLIDAAESNPQFSMFGSLQLSASNPKILDGDGDIYHITGLAWRQGNGKHNYQPVKREIFSPCAAASLYERQSFIAVGGFDEDFFCYMEDVDLGFRLRLQGCRCLLVPEAIVHHVGSATTGGERSKFSIYHGHRNLVWTYVKNMPGFLFWLLLPLHVLLNCVSIFWFTFLGYGDVIFKSKYEAMLNLKNMWRKRIEIQKNRKISLVDIWKNMDKSFLVFGRK